MKTFEDVVDFLKKAGTYYLATDDGGQPRVRRKAVHPDREEESSLETDA